MTAGIAKERAERDLGCPRAQLIAEREREGSGEYFIHGCGKRALYVCDVAGRDTVSCRRY